MDKVMLIYLLTFISNIIDMFSYSVCIVGIKTKRLALSTALFQIVMIIARISMFIQAPLLASIADDAIMSGQVDGIEIVFRNVIFIISIGSIVGGLATPIFVDMFAKLINYVDRTKSISKALINIALNLRKVPKQINMQEYKDYRVSLKDIPLGIIIFNTVIISVYSVGVASAIYAGALSPEYRMTAGQFAAGIVGMADALLLIFIEPVQAILTDKTLEGKISPRYIKSLVFYLVISDFIGTLVSQIIFIPLTNLIIFVIQNM